MFTSHHTVKMHGGAFSDINSTSLGYVHLRHGDDDGDDGDDEDDDDDDDWYYSPRAQPLSG